MIRLYKLVIITIIVCMLFISSCGIIKKSDNTSLEQSIYEFSKTYTVSDERSDGQYEVVINAPDYSSIVKHLIQNGDGHISIEAINEEIQNNRFELKEYRFNIESITDTSISQTFEDVVIQEIIVTAIAQNEYREGALQ